MSLSKKKDVRQLVEKYRHEFPSLERPFLRKLIRSEMKIENPSELKKLDRYLAKAFKNEAKLTTKKKLEESASFMQELEKAKEDWIKGLKEDAERRVVFIINGLKPQQQTPGMRQLINERNELLENPYSLDGGSWGWRHPGVHKFNFQIAQGMTARFIEILYEVQKKGNED